MATARLVPSTYYLSNTQYVSVSNADNMYENTDSTSHGTVTHNRASTNSTYYIYLRGFNFSSIPSDANVSGFAIKIKASATGHTTSTSSSYYMSLYNGTTAIASTSASGRLGTTLTTFTFAEGSLTWDTIVSYGSNFGIRIPLRRASSDTADVVSIYGAEIEVTYTIPTPHTITSTLSGNGTIVPSGATTINEGESYELTITPTNVSETVTATKNGTDITNDLVIHYVPGSTTSDDRVLGTYALVSGGFNGSGASYFQGLVGKGYNGSTTTSNYYSGGSSTTAVFTYDMSFTLPAGAEVTSLYVRVNGHAESTSQSSEYMCAQLISGDVDLSPELNFKSVGTSNSTQTITATVMPTVEQAANMKLQCRLGYYGGAINGATCYIEYDVPTTDIDHYTYTYEVDGDATIAVTIGGGGSQATIYVKVNSSWVPATAVYKKVNGAWVQQSDLSNVFDTTKNYVKG